MGNYCDLIGNEEDGFVDFTFDVINFKNKLFGNIFIECAANYNGENIGFGLEIQKNMRGIVNNDFRTFRIYEKGFKMTFLNGFSDNFLKCIAGLYGFVGEGLRLNESSFIACGALDGNPKHIKNEEVRFKCFLNSDDEEKYAEFYINTDLKNRKIYLNEKDPDYRENIIKYLGR